MLNKILIAILVAFPCFAQRLPDKQTIGLTPKNSVVLRGIVNDSSTTNIQLALAELDAERGSQNFPIYLVIDSPGGSIDAGESFIQFAKTIPNLQTISIFAASMASAIVEGLPGRRSVTQNGILMFHRAKGGFEGQFNDGEIEQELALFKSFVQSMEERNAARLKLTIDAYKAKVKDEFWAFGDNTVTTGMADEVINIKCSKELIDTRTREANQSIFGTVTTSYSGCPLFRAPLPEEATSENQ